MSFREHTRSNDNVSIKVKRANSKKNAIRRFFGLDHNIRESTFGDGYLTAIKREYVPETGDYKEIILCKDKHNMLTFPGRDYFHIQCYGTAASITAQSGTVGTNFVAVTATAITVGTGDTALSGELSGNGFTRVQGTVAHSANATTTTVSATFTCGATPQNNVQASALFNAATSGIMSHEATFTSTNFVQNDQLSIVWTLTLS